MTVEKLAEGLQLEYLNKGDVSLEVSGGYCGDLLSWVMGRAEEGNAWITIMSNINVAAVAVMAGVSCVILCEGVKPDDELLKRAETEEINLLVTDKAVFEIAVALGKML